MDGDDEFYESLQDLADRGQDLVDGDAEDVREERGRSMDIQLLREIIYGLERVSLGTHQLLYFSAMKYARKYLGGEADEIAGAVEELAARFDAMNLGTLALDEEGWPAVLELRENAFTHNAPESGRTMCYFLSGYIAGFLENALSGQFVVNEVACSAEGGPACRFRVQER